MTTTCTFAPEVWGKAMKQLAGAVCVLSRFFIFAPSKIIFVLKISNIFTRVGNQYLLLTGIALVLLAAGCTFYQPTYTNHLPHDPAFEKGGEAVGGGTSGIYGTNVQAAVSPVHFLGITAGAYHAWTNRYSYNYGVLSYVPVAQLKNQRLFLSLHYEIAGGGMNGKMDSRATYKGINLRPSVYILGNFDDLYIKTGITYQWTETVYSRLFVYEKSVEPTILMVPRVMHNVAADAHNIKFTGYGFYWFMEITDQQSRFSGAINLGVMPSRYNYRVVGNEPVQNREFRHRISSFYTFSVKYRLQLY